MLYIDNVNAGPCEGDVGSRPSRPNVDTNCDAFVSVCLSDVTIANFVCSSKSNGHDRKRFKKKSERLTTSGVLDPSVWLVSAVEARA